ncbi:MAG: hypothetical protein C4539_05670 [Ignavibacteriales bacterium]|nr:MAG: hypothetical protein C4539_05670 [Ignavibacteriales bacterium]
MKKYFILLFLLCLKALAQVDSSEIIYNNIDRFLYFMSVSNNIIALSWKDNFNQQCIRIWSKDDGNLMKEVLLEYNEDVKAFNVSHDDSSFIIMSRSIDEDGKNAYIIKKYLIQENRWAWKKIWYKTASWAWLKSWYSKAPCLRLAYSDDNKQIICVTYLHTLILNSEDGEIINKSNEITSVLEHEDYLAIKMDLSSNGRYFIFWGESQFPYDEYGQSKFAQGMKEVVEGIGSAIYSSKKKYIYVWDIFGDTLKCSIEIPKKTSIGAPVFTKDETKFIYGTLNDFYYEHSLEEEKIIREWRQDSVSIKKPNSNYSWSGFKIISPDNKYFASFTYSDVSVIDCFNGNQIKFWHNYNAGSYQYFDPYQMAFSSDSKYFALEHDGKICLYSTTDWEMIWSKQTY